MGQNSYKSKPTIAQIAENLGVSQSTVSKGLNGAKDISEDMRQKILLEAVRIGYRVKRPRGGESRTLALFLENTGYRDEDDFGCDIVAGFEQAAVLEGWEVRILEVDPDFQRRQHYDTCMLSNGFAGAFIMGFEKEDPWMREFPATQYPTVLFDNTLKDAGRNCAFLSTDNARAMNLSLKHLIGLGHEKIAFLDGTAASYVSDLRMSGYLSSMRRYRLPLDPNLAVYASYDPSCVEKHVPIFLSLGATAILCASDLLAESVISCLQKKGLRVPQDVSVIGFDDLPLCERTTPPLTTIRQDRLSFGKSSIYLLQALQAGCQLGWLQQNPQLIVRSSTAKARPRLVTNREIEDPDSVLRVKPQLFTAGTLYLDN